MCDGCLANLLDGTGGFGRVHRARQQHRVQVGRERTHFFHGRLVATDQPVVAEHGRHCDAQADGRAVQVGRDQNASDTPGAGSVPGRVDQYAKVSDDASVTQVGVGQLSIVEQNGAGNTAAVTQVGAGQVMVISQ